ncbi:ABC transporter ATP-binding protein [Alphaproteobacteria bacterium]|nr:ABC transporter ATP-binding protein [Alphaproteobacteria bacterium]
MSEAIEINNVNKVYSNGFVALKEINLKIHSGEIFALLGPNGAGKSTLINIICGLTKKNSGEISIFNFDNEKSYKQARSLIGLVPQEIATDSFEKVINTIRFTRGLFNKINSEEYIESILKKLSLWEKKDQQIRTLSGGMKRRLMIAKAMSHEPKILFLDEPTAGVDVELRKSMWEQIIKLKQLGVTIVLTTHYIEEAEKIADRIGIIDKGEIILVEDKKDILKKLGNRKIIFSLTNEINEVPRGLKHLDIIVDKKKIICFVDKTNEKKKLSKLIKDFAYNSIEIENIEIEENTLEDIFIELVKK